METRTLRTSQDITTYNIYIYVNIETDLLTQLYLFEHKVINQLWRPPHLEHPKTLQHIYFQNDLLTEKNNLNELLFVMLWVGSQG